MTEDPKDEVATSIQRGRVSQLPPVEEEGARFEDRGELAAGGTSSIRHVFDRRIRRDAAMKVIDPLVATWPDAARLLVEEAQITGQLDHPNIVPVHDLGVTVDGAPMFVMKLIEGRTMTELIEGGEKLQRLLGVFLRVCDAVAFAHSRGVVHRDLKPDNVMIGSHGQVYVMDWGCATLAGRATGPAVQLSSGDRRVIDGTGTVIGTAAYMAPEQAAGDTDKIDERTDVFGLGAILYQILTGHPPFRGKNHLESVQRAQASVFEPPDGRAPPELARIAMKAMASAREARHASVEALQAEVAQFLDGGFCFATHVFPAGAIVMREGDEADAAYLITGGTCEAFHVEGGQRVSLRRMGPGEVFGEAAILAGGTRTASVVALEELTTQVVTRASLEHEVTARSWFGILVRALAERFRDLDEQLRKR